MQGVPSGRLAQFLQERTFPEYCFGQGTAGGDRLRRVPRPGTQARGGYGKEKRDSRFFRDATKTDPGDVPDLSQQGDVAGEYTAFAAYECGCGLHQLPLDSQSRHAEVPFSQTADRT